MAASKFTPDVQDRICQLLKVGNTNEIAAEACGISVSTFYEWKRDKPAFRAAVEQADAEAEAMLVARISKAAAAGSWRAACWLLERRYSDDWAEAKARGEQPGEDPVRALYEVSNPGRVRRAS